MLEEVNGQLCDLLLPNGSHRRAELGFIKKRDSDKALYARVRQVLAQSESSTRLVLGRTKG